MINKESILEEYIAMRGGTTVAVPVSDKDFDVSWKLTVRKVREYKYIGNSIPVVLEQGLTLPEDGEDLYMFIPPDTSNIYDNMTDISDVSSFLEPKKFNTQLRAVYLKEDINNMVSWIVSADYDRVNEVIIIDNFAGHRGETCLMLYELKEDYFQISYLNTKEQNWFTDYLYAILDYIIGRKLKRAGVEEGDEFISDGKEGKSSLIEEAGGVFVYPTLLFT